MVAGLGNPGGEYTRTRHNAGFLCLDRIAGKYGAQLPKAKFSGLVSECDAGGSRILLVKPQTFMNNSGECVAKVLDYYKLGPESLIVICDDISFGCGRMRVRKNGSDGGHNGLKSIISHIGSGDFVRIRLGIGGKPCPEYDLADWVLSSFSDMDLEKMGPCFDAAAEALPLIIKGETERAMSLCNGIGKTT